MLPFAEVWLADFEFRAPPGERPDPVCLVAREWRSGRTIRLWQDELRRMSHAPFPTGPDAVFVAYYASAEIGCFLELGWPLPARVLDLFCEFRNCTNGAYKGKNRLIEALAYLGLDSIGAVEKQAMIDLILRGGWSPDERAAILDYCESDVLALAQLLPRLLPTFDLPAAC